MNRRMISYVVALVMAIEAGLMLFPALVGFVYGERSAWSFVISAAIAGGISALILVCFKPKNKTFYAREGLVATALSWIAMSVIGALPFFVTGQIPNYIDALFEMVSGFTTTGSSILLDVEALDKCMLLWRSFSHWIGGMGVLVFMMALLPMAGGQNLHLMRAESPGPSITKLVPKLRYSALWLYGIYMVLTVLCFLLLWVGGMPVFDAACMAFGTAGTGGFGILSSGYADYNYFCQTVTTIFMMLFGVNFNFYYFLCLKKVRDAVKMEEVRWYFIVYFFVVITIILDLLNAGLLGNGARGLDVFFSAASVMTTTGYATADFNLWPTYSRVILIALMFCGACAGSTGGGMKVSRWMICGKAISKELRRMTHSHSVQHIRMDGKRVEDSVVRNTLVYMVLFAVIYVGSLLIICLDGLDPVTSFTAVAATINNIGPGLELVGPMGNFSCFSWLSKLVLTVDMLVGRLEVFPMMILFLPSTWKKNT